MKNDNACNTFGRVQSTNNLMNRYIVVISYLTVHTDAYIRY